VQCDGPSFHSFLHHRRQPRRSRNDSDVGAFLSFLEAEALIPQRTKFTIRPRTSPFPWRHSGQSDAWCAREKRKRSHCILELHPPSICSLRHSSATDPATSTAGSHLWNGASRPRFFEFATPICSVHGYDTQHQILVFAGKLGRREDGEFQVV